MLRSLSIAALLTTAIASAQFSTTFSAANGGTTVTFVPQPAAPNYAFSGAPYAARQGYARVQTTNTGGHLAQPPTFTEIWQDAEGRKRTERQYAIANAKIISVTQILDPVEGFVYILDPALNVAHRIKITAKLAKVHTTASTPPIVPPHTTTNTDGSSFTTESLGAKTIAGFNANGLRTTMHYPAGSSLGNDQPVDSVNEMWNVPQLGAAISTKASDPRFGDSTTELSNIVPGEPDPTLLRPPSGYRIIDETGPFSLSIATP